MTDFEMKDTRQIQADSLLAFMDALGYKVRDNGQGFERVAQDKSQYRYLSFTTGIRLHNTARQAFTKTSTDGWHNIPGLDGMFINAYALNIAFARKLVHKVKMQACKRKGGVVVTGNMVKPASRGYASLFGLN